MKVGISMNEEYKNLSQKERIINVLKVLKEGNTDLLKVDISILRKYLTPEDIQVLYKMYMEVEDRIKDSKKNNKKLSFIKAPTDFELKSDKNNLENINIELKWEEITPYTVLEIEKRDYTKEELIDIVGKRINYIKDNSGDYEDLRKKLDDILDAYNELTKESNKQR